MQFYAYKIEMEISLERELTLIALKAFTLYKIVLTKYYAHTYTICNILAV